MTLEEAIQAIYNNFLDSNKDSLAQLLFNNEGVEEDGFLVVVGDQEICFCQYRVNALIVASAINEVLANRKVSNDS